MKGKRSTKNALISSILVFALCVSMLIGATFAWFTDTASTSVNKIQAGSLDVALVDAVTGQSVEGQTLSFLQKQADGTLAQVEDILWEPGCRYQLPELKVVNNGNLALKYKIIITGIQGSAKLNEAIEWTINGNGLDADRTLAVGGEDTLNIQGHMLESAGNEYQGLSIDGIAITVFATQATVESDSIDNLYDQLAGTNFAAITVVNGESTPLEKGNTYTLGNATVAVDEDGNVSYTNEGAAQTATIYTNGHNLTVNAPNDTVYHYGEAGTVLVENCAMDSYHENGEVITLNVKAGHVELADTAVVTALVVEPASDATVKITVKESAEITNSVVPEGVPGKEEVEQKAKKATSDIIEANNAGDLNAALNVTEGYVYVRLGADINVGNTSISVAPTGGNANITIDGNGHTITSTHSRAIQTCANSGSFAGVLTINNLKLDNQCAYTSYNIRGLSLWNFTGTLNLVGSTIDIAEGHDTYGINLAPDTITEATLNIKNTNITAYQCVNIYGIDHKVNIDGCTLTSYNTHNSGYTGGCVTVFEKSSADVVIDNTALNIEVTDGYPAGYPFASSSALGEAVGKSLTVNNCTVNGTAFGPDHIDRRGGYQTIIFTINGKQYTIE